MTAWALKPWWTWLRFLVRLWQVHPASRCYIIVVWTDVRRVTAFHTPVHTKVFLFIYFGRTCKGSVQFPCVGHERSCGEVGQWTLLIGVPSSVCRVLVPRKKSFRRRLFLVFQKKGRCKHLTSLAFSDRTANYKCASSLPLIYGPRASLFNGGWKPHHVELPYGARTRHIRGVG